MASNLTPPDVVTGIRSQIDALRARSDESTPALRITDVFNSLVQAAAAMSKYGMITVIFALPLVVACFRSLFSLDVRERSRSKHAQSFGRHVYGRVWFRPADSAAMALR